MRREAGATVAEGRGTRLALTGEEPRTIVSHGLMDCAMTGSRRESAGASGRTKPTYMLRRALPGDMGWVLERHAVLYASEYGWGSGFESLVAGVVGDFLERFDPDREHCWIAEHEGKRIGTVMLVRHPEREDVAKLRLLLVEPEARGMGLGKHLVQECTRFARLSAYHTITLWTNSVLDAARRIYIEEGYTLVHEEPHTMFGKDLVGQTWELKL